MADGKVICLLSDSEADDSAPKDFSRGQKRNCNCSFHCTACGTEMFAVSEIHEHPQLLGVGICSECFDYLFSGPFTKDPLDGKEEQCRWCGRGGTIVICDNCEKAFCENCIVRNYGRKRGLAPILSNVNWSCFCCNPKPLCVHVDRLIEFRHSVSAGTKFSPRPNVAVARTSKTRDANLNASDVNLKNQRQTVAELLVQNKEQNQDQGEWIQTKSRNRKSREKPSTEKRVATCTTKRHHPPEAKQQKGIEKLQQAPSVPPARTFIRPYEMIEKRREAAERRWRMAAERLKSGVTNGKENIWSSAT